MGANRLLLFSFLLVCVTGFLHTSPVTAQSGSQNAADIYREAFEIVQAMSLEDRELLSQYREGTTGLTPAVQAVLSRAQPAIRLYERAAAIDHIDWGIDYSQGPATLLPHLSPMRFGTQLLAAEAQARIDSGDPRGAAQLFAATYRMCDQVTDDPVLINSLVGLAMNTHVNNQLNHAIQQGLIGPAESRMILEAALPVAGAEDPLGLVASFQGERDCFAGWLKGNFMGEGGMEQFVDEMLPFLGVLDETDATAAPFMEMDQTAFNSAIMSYDLALERAVAAVSLDDLGAAREEMARIEADTEAGLYGPLAPLVLPALDRALEAFIRGYQRFDVTIEQLQQLRDDPEAQARLRNAAHWYLRAIKLWNELSEETRELIREAPAATRGPDADSQESLHAALVQAQPIIDIILEASEIERCDFDLDQAWKYQGMLASLPHLAGMTDLAKLVAADADRAGQEADNRAGAEAAKRIAAIYHMANHLGMDGQLRSTRAAIELAEIAHGRAAGIDRGSLAESELELVRRAIEQLSQSRFGLRQAAHTYPTFTIEWLIGRGGANPARERYEACFAASGDNRDRSALLDAIEGMDDETHGHMLEAVRTLVREWSSAVARTGAVPEECRSTREQFNRAWPAAFADWLLEPLEEAVREVDAAMESLAAEQ